MLTPLQMIVNPVKETETNSKGIHYVIERMSWFCELSSHLPKESDPNGTSYVGLRSGLKEQLIQLYKVLLSYQMMSVCSYYQNRDLVFLKDLVQLHDWNGQLDDINKIEATFQRSITQYKMQQNMDFNQQISETLNDINGNLQELPLRQRELSEVKNSECLRVLRLTDPEHDMGRIEGTKDRLLPESSTWILYHSCLTDWRHSKTTRLLWMRADPGKGKTMLMISIVKELQSIPEFSPLSFFFCQVTDARLNNATAVGLALQTSSSKILSHLTPP